MGQHGRRVMWSVHGLTTTSSYHYLALPGPALPSGGRAVSPGRRDLLMYLPTPCLPGCPPLSLGPECHRCHGPHLAHNTGDYQSRLTWQISAGHGTSSPGRGGGPGGGGQSGGRIIFQKPPPPIFISSPPTKNQSIFLPDGLRIGGFGVA